MAWLFRKSAPPARIQTKVGLFSFDGSGWTTEPTERSLVFISGDNLLDTCAIERLHALLPTLDQYTNAALRYIETHGAELANVTQGLTLESVDFSDILEDGLSLCFGRNDDSDYTVHVEFHRGTPLEVWGAD